MTQTKDHCYVCGAPPRAEDPSVPEEYYRELWCHTSCLNSPKGIAWRRDRTQRDAGYARYLRLSSVGLRMPCPSCGQVCGISAKARGMGAGSWEACCSRCDRTTFLNGDAHQREYARLLGAETDFLMKADNDAWRRQVSALAATADKKLRGRVCTCGGKFSLAAKPRCPRCHAVLLDTYFHYAHVAPQDAVPD